MSRIKIITGISVLVAAVLCTAIPRAKESTTSPTVKNTAVIRLQALTPTSGEHAEHLLDGLADTGWEPTGDPVNEGVLFRFEEPMKVDAITMKPCAASKPFSTVAYFNGTEISAKKKNGLWVFSKRSWKKTGLKSFFLRITKAKGKVCIGEVTFRYKKQRLAVAPPQSVTGTVEVSSTLSPAEAYHKSYLFDKRIDFGWVEGAQGLGIGEHITVSLAAPQRIEGLEIWNGYQRSKDHFRKNARVKRIQVRVDGYPAQEFTLKDSMGMQRIRLAEPVTGRRIVLTIKEAWPGKKYQDLVISELRFINANGPFSVATTDAAQLRKALLASIKGTPLETLVDRQLENVCGYKRDAEPDKPGHSLKLRSDHTFVSYEQVGDGNFAYRKDVFEGTWILKTSSGTKATIEFFGRRSNADLVIPSYGSWARDMMKQKYPNHKQRKTVIAGGQAEITFVKDMPFSTYKKKLKKLMAGGHYTVLGRGCLLTNYEYEGFVVSETLSEEALREYYKNDDMIGLEKNRYREIIMKNAFIIAGRGMVDVLYPVKKK